MARKRHGKISILLLLTAGALVLTMLVSVSELVWKLELQTLDARFKLRGPVDVKENDIIVVGIDDQTYAELPERWPFPREYYARFIRNIIKAGARMIVFDVQFTEPGRKSMGEDSLLAAAVAEAKESVVLAGKILEERNPYIKETLKHVFPPIPVLLKTGAEWGIVNEPNDPDGFTRRYLLYQPFGDKTYLPIGIKAVKLFKGYHDTTKVGIEDNCFRYGDLSVPLFDRNTMLVNFCGPAKTFPTYSFSDILDDSEFNLRENDTDYMESFYSSADLPPEFAALLKNPFKDKIVFLGATIEEQKDTFFSPFYGFGGIKEKTPGVEYHANAIWTILNQAFINTLELHHIYLIMLALALITGLVVHYLKIWGGLAALVVEIALLTFAAIYLFNNHHLWVEITGPALAAIFSFAGAGGYQFITEQKEKHQIKGMFQHYLAKDLVDELIANPDKLKLGGDKKELTVFFSDIESFTSISEGLPPERLLVCLNEYLSVMTDIILENDGMLDKYIGDAIVAVWGAPILREDHARLACLTSVRMQRELEKMRGKWEEEGKPLFKARIGLNTGPMTIGNVGSHQRLSYTVIGDTVNLASRLENINKQYKSYIMVSEFTRKEIDRDFHTRELDLITVKGKTEPVRIFQLLEETTVPLPQPLKVALGYYSEGLKYYYEKSWDKAMDLFIEALKANPDDFPSQMFVDRCEYFKANPPPEVWDGVWEYKVK